MTKSSKDPLAPLVKALSRLPSLGPRSARRIALYLLTHKNQTMLPLIDALSSAAEDIRPCKICGNLDRNDICHICDDETRSHQSICVIASVGDLWAIERSGSYKGVYHVLGGVLSALDGVRPEDLKLESLLDRLGTSSEKDDKIDEVIIALGATVDGQATAHYLSDKIKAHNPDVKISRLAHGVPVGGELDYLDDGTIATALQSRSAL